MIFRCGNFFVDVRLFHHITFLCFCCVSSKDDYIHVGIWLCISVKKLCVDSYFTKMASLEQTLTGHASDINGLAFNLSTLASCSSDRTIRLWSLTDYTELACSPLIKHSYPVHGCVFSTSGCKCMHESDIFETEVSTYHHVLVHVYLPFVLCLLDLYR